MYPVTPVLDPDLERGSVSKIFFFLPFGPQFGLNIQGAAPPPPPPRPGSSPGSELEPLLTQLLLLSIEGVANGTIRDSPRRRDPS